MSPEEIADAADALADAERSGTAIEALTERWPGMTPHDAYGVQMHNARRRLDAGARLVGHKVGLTALAMQQYFKIDEPDYGHLFEDMFVLEGGDVPASRFIAPKVECELGFILRRTLQGPGVTVVDAVRATECVLPTIEIIDSRVVDWRIQLADTIADNGSSAAVVVGGRPMRLEDFDPRAIPAELHIDGKLAAEGRTDAVWGNPVNVVAWLANKLAAFGIALEEGHLVMTGSATVSADVEAGNDIAASLGPFGTVRIRFT